MEKQAGTERTDLPLPGNRITQQQYEVMLNIQSKAIIC